MLRCHIDQGAYFVIDLVREANEPTFMLNTQTKVHNLYIETIFVSEHDVFGLKVSVYVIKGVDVIDPFQYVPYYLACLNFTEGLVTLE